MPLLLNLNVSIINPQLSKILKASVPLVCKGKHLYWIIALRLITMPAITNTHRPTHTEGEESKCETLRMHNSLKVCLCQTGACCSSSKLSSLERAVTLYKEASVRANHCSKTSDCIGNSSVCDNHIESLCAQPQQANSGLGEETKS